MNSVKAYKNELILAFAFLLLVIAFFYKQGVVASQNVASSDASNTLIELKETITLQRIWANKQSTKKVENLRKLLSPSSIKWKRTGKKLTALFSNLSAIELNRMVVKVMNLPVLIEKLDVTKSGTSYTMELKCKW